MNLEQINKKYGKRIVKKACKELDRLNKPLLREELIKMCDKLRNN